MPSSRSRKRTNRIRAALWRAAVLMVIGILIAFVLAYGAHPACRDRSANSRKARSGSAWDSSTIASRSKPRRTGAAGHPLQPDGGRACDLEAEVGAYQSPEAVSGAAGCRTGGNSDRAARRAAAGSRRGVRRSRGFTAFSARAEPEIIIAALQEYYEAVGAVTARHEATLIRLPVTA